MAIYLSKDGSQEIHISKEAFIDSNDDLVATHWLSSAAKRYFPQTDVWKLGYENSLEEYRKYINSDIYKKNLHADIIAQFAIGVIGGVVGFFSCGLLAGVVILGLNVLYQTTIKTALNEYWRDSSDNSHELGKIATHSYGDAIANGWIDYGKSWLTGWGRELFTQYTNVAYFSDINPFDIDLYGLTTDQLRTHPNATVWVSYTLPQIWYPNDENWVASAKFWIDKTDPFHKTYCDAIKIFLTSNPTPTEQLIMDQFQTMPIFRYLRAYLGQDTIPSYEQYLVAKAHVLHQYYYRDNPSDSITPTASLNPVETSIRSQSQSYKKYLEYATIKTAANNYEIGRPTLTASSGAIPFLNYSDPVAYYVDYLEMCLISRYQTGYESAQQYNVEIAMHQLRDTVILTAAGVLGCFVGSAWGVKIAAFKTMGVKMSFSAAFKQVMTAGASENLGGAGQVLHSVGKFSWQMLDEMVLEQITSESLQLLGMNAQVADLVGEAYGMGNVIDSITSSVKGRSGNTASAQQLADRYAFTVSDTHSAPSAASSLVSNLHYLTQLQSGAASAKKVATRTEVMQQQLLVFYRGYTQTAAGINLQQQIAIGQQLEGMQALKYNSKCLTQTEIEARLRAKLGDLVVDCLLTSTVEGQIELLWHYLEGGSDAKSLGLVKGRYQFLRLQLVVDSVSTTVDLTTRNADGSLATDVLVHYNGQTVNLAMFLQLQGIASVPALLAMSTKYEMIDPPSGQTNSQKDILYDKNGNIIQRISDVFETIEQNTNNWINTVQEFKLCTKNGIGFNVRVATYNDAIQLLKDVGLKQIISEKFPSYCSRLYGFTYQVGFEVHYTENRVGNDLPHIHYCDFSIGKEFKGHIFFNKFNLVK